MCFLPLWTQKNPPLSVAAIFFFPFCPPGALHQRLDFELFLFSAAIFFHS